MDYEHGDTASELNPPKEYKLPPEELDTEFKKEFPPDPTIGSEMDDAARVWKVYRKEAMAYDSTLLEGWSSTLDILLIFGGLFSAVATAFVIESYQLLQPDNAAYTAAALYILVSASNHSSGATLPPPPDLSFASPITRWVNGLWFTSILLSLAVALLSILVKQWITEYRSRNNASAKSPRDWARRHQLYSQALRAWPVAEVVSLLPVLLHLSLFLFIAGVVAFLWGLDQVIGIWIIVLGVLLAIFYAACTLIPLWTPECPTSTPLVIQIRKVVVPCVLIVIRMCAAALALRLHLRRLITNRVRRQRSQLPTQQPEDRFVLPIMHPGPSGSLNRAVLRTRILLRDKSAVEHRLEQQRDALDASTLQWLITDVSDSDAVAVGFQALGAIPPTSALADLLRVYDTVAYFSERDAYTRSTSTHGPAEILRASRSMLCMRRHFDGSNPMWVYSILTCRDIDYPDLSLLSLKSSERSTVDHVASWYRRTTTITSTAALLIRAGFLDLSCMLTCLLCCDLDLLSDTEWDIILRALGAVDDVAITDYDVRLLPSSFRHYERILRLLGRDALHSSDDTTQEAAARLIPRVLRWHMPRSNWDEPFLQVQPSLLEFFASDRFLAQAHIPDEIEGVAHFLWQNSEHLLVKGVTVSNFWSAIARVTHIARGLESTPWNARALRKIAYACVSCCEFTLSACANNPSDHALGGTLSGILDIPSTALTHDKRSIWASLAVVWDTDPRAMLSLAHVLAAALCSHARSDRIRVATLIDSYFSEMVSTRIWTNLVSRDTRDAARKSFEDESSREDAIHLVQHCIELQPQWWLDSFDNARVAGSEDVHRLVLDLDAEVCLRGPCMRCPNVGRSQAAHASEGALEFTHLGRDDTLGSEAAARSDA